MKSKILAVTALSVLFGAAEPAIGQVVQCARMQANLDELQDGSVFYRPHAAPGTIAWKRLPAGQPIDASQPTRMDFIYVARESWLPEGRPGMVVIKSGQTAGAAPSPPGPEMVGLRRIETAEANVSPSCGTPFSYKGRVLGESYDRYHDSRSRIPLGDQEILEKRFHTGYFGRGGRCKLSNDPTGDTIFGRSNRGQFSFSDNVVGAQFRSQLFAAIGVSPSYAGTFSNRAVEVRRYRTDENRIACVAFTLTVAQPNFFLKINDLERVKGSERFPERGDEWSTSH